MKRYLLDIYFVFGFQPRVWAANISYIRVPLTLKEKYIKRYLKNFYLKSVKEFNGKPLPEELLPFYAICLGNLYIQIHPATKGEWDATRENYFGNGKSYLEKIIKKRGEGLWI